MGHPGIRFILLVGLGGLGGWLLHHAGPPSNWMPAWSPNPSAPLDQVLSTFALWALVTLFIWALLGTAFYALALLIGREGVTRRAARITPRWCRRWAERLAATFIGFSLLGAAGPVHAVQDVPAEASEAADPGGTDIPHPGLSRLTRSGKDRTPLVSPAAGTKPPSADHLVVRGDNLWAIAADRLAAHPDTALTIREYWLLVIDANRDRLRSGNPDLIFPGETVVLPPPREAS